MLLSTSEGSIIHCPTDSEADRLSGGVVRTGAIED